MPDLTFLGYGDGLHPELGNTSAFFMDTQDHMVLIDCGNTVYTTLKKNGLLQNRTRITVVNTHTHSDHIGSLPALILDEWFSFNHKTTIISADKKHQRFIESILQSEGCPKDSYQIETIDETDTGFHDPTLTMHYLKTDHVDDIPAYSIIFNKPDGMWFYTGDTRNLKVLSEYVQHGSKFHAIYADCAGQDNPVHTSLQDLIDTIPEQLRRSVFCMHTDSANTLERAVGSGFRSVQELMIGDR
jgi:ribonuclease BN (tRNA processing enzyme)